MWGRPKPHARHDQAITKPQVVRTTGPTADAVGPSAGALTGADELTAAVEGARRGDAESFRILYREAQPRLLRYLGYLVGGEAEDIASETWLQATRDLGQFRGSHGDFCGWITTIARNRAMDHVRRVSRQPPAVPVPVEELAFVAGGEDTADRALEAIGTAEALRLIASLPPDQAEAVLLRAVVGLDAKRAAQVVGKRPGAVRTAAHRGLKAMAKRIECQSRSLNTAAAAQAGTPSAAPSGAQLP